LPRQAGRTRVRLPCAGRRTVHAVFSRVCSLSACACGSGVTRGTLHGGHYTTITRSLLHDDGYWLCNDEAIGKLTVQEAEHSMKSAVLLFYLSPNDWQARQQAACADMLAQHAGKHVGKSAVQYRGMHSIDHGLSPIQNTRVHITLLVSAARQLRQAVDLTRIFSFTRQQTYACVIKHNLLPIAERASFLVDSPLYDDCCDQSPPS